MKGLAIVFQQNLITGVHFRFRKDMMLGKQRDIFLTDKQRQGIDRGFQIQKPALFRLGDPFFRIVVAVEDDALMLPDNPLNEGFQRSLKIRGSFQLIGKLCQRFRNNGIENQVGAGRCV